jgi:hypothetical protein
LSSNLSSAKKKIKEGRKDGRKEERKEERKKKCGLLVKDLPSMHEVLCSNHRTGNKSQK